MLIAFLKTITKPSVKNLQPLKSVYHRYISIYPFDHVDHLSATSSTITTHFPHLFCIIRIRWARTLESGITSGIPLRGDSLSCASHLINTIIFLTTYLSSQDAFLHSRSPKLGACSSGFVACPSLKTAGIRRSFCSLSHKGQCRRLAPRPGLTCGSIFYA